MIGEVGSGPCVNWMADPGVRRAAAKASVGQNHRRIDTLRAILSHSEETIGTIERPELMTRLQSRPEW
jgi:hypothetical protein